MSRVGLGVGRGLCCGLGRAATPLLCLAVLGGAGCGKLRERQAIRRYAEGAARANHALAKLRALEANLLLVRRAGRVARVRGFFRDTYLPAVKAHLDAVRSVPTGTARLRAIHGRYVKALEALHEAYASYADHVTTATLLSGWVPVQQARQRLAAAEDRYRREIAAYYRKNDVRLAAE